ncbi:MAG: Putative lipoprotein [uncultured Campylobacterales bacterium]|uniref:Lipoprotein n=1 Tax=uncultured Campylobacterales bacterium TaxID=352960 RepID=A0A6S6T6I6_9BACT|nr:MAG: Putative lipoprotein [uncultured Campylobacterales bacterium]
MKYLIINFTFLILLIGCGAKNIDKSFNKSEEYWFNKITKSVKNNQLNLADDYYISLYSEHISSPYLPILSLYLAKAHADDKAYIMSIFYYDEYLDKFALKSDEEYVNYLKLKARYQNVSHISKSQISLKNAITEIQNFKTKFPNSIYILETNTILASLKTARDLQLQTIANLYKKLGHTKAQDIYIDKNNQTLENFDLPNAPWYKKIFE